MPTSDSQTHLLVLADVFSPICSKKLPSRITRRRNLAYRNFDGGGLGNGGPCEEVLSDDTGLGHRHAYDGTGVL